MNNKIKITLSLLMTSFLAACNGTTPSVVSSSQEASSETPSSENFSSYNPTSENPSSSEALHSSTLQPSSEAQVSSEASQSSQQTQSSEVPSSELPPSSEEMSSEGSSSQASSSSSRDIQYLPEIDHIQVFCPKEWTTLYAWSTDGKETKYLGAWPGSSTALQTYSADTYWKTYSFDKDLESVYFIFNKGNNAAQTDNLRANGPGYYWFYDDSNIKLNYDPHLYQPETPDSRGNYDLVENAPKYTDLPAVKNYSGSVINKYSGSRDDFRDESIYFAMTTRFYDGDANNNAFCWDSKNEKSDPDWRGDFKGLIQKLDYIKALGFTAVWITPIVKNASGLDYHGYHAINMKEVDPRLESDDASFQDLINAAHAKDMKIVLDVVFNHTGNFGEENLLPTFYYDAKNDTTINGVHRNPDLIDESYDSQTPGQQYQTRLSRLKSSKDKYNIYHHSDAMSWESESEQTGQIAGDCVDLNTENPTVANYIIEAYSQFIKMGVDAFRIDTMKHISRLTFNNYYFPAFQAIAKKARGDDKFFMFGEVCTRVREVFNKNQPCDSAPFYGWKENKTYAWGTNEQNNNSTHLNWEDNKTINSSSARTTGNVYLNSNGSYHTPDHSAWNGTGVIDFPMHWNFYEANNAYGVAVGNDQYYNDASYNVTYVDSHDYSPDDCQDFRYNGGTSRWKNNLSLLFTFRGIPCIYYGSEIEFMKGARVDSGGTMPLSETGRAYFGNHITGDVTATGFGKYSSATGNVKGTLTSTLSKHIEMLSQIRNIVPALRRGQYANMDGNYIGFVRRYNNSVACVTINGSTTFKNVPNGRYVDLVSGNEVTVSNGTFTKGVTKSNLAVYVLDNGASSGTLKSYYVA